MAVTIETKPMTIKVLSPEQQEIATGAVMAAANETHLALARELYKAHRLREGVEELEGLKPSGSRSGCGRRSLSRRC